MCETVATGATRGMRAWTARGGESKSRRDAIAGAARTMGVCVAAWSRKKVTWRVRTWSRRRVHLTGQRTRPDGSTASVPIVAT